AALVAKVLATAQSRRAGKRDDGWRLGPWPVDPAAIKTREELIQAFEYLSLLNLGPAARNWNHLAIADGLRNTRPSAVPSTAALERSTPASGAAADELASLYEQARYAPPSDPLPDTALITARRDLCLLAGVSSA